MMAKKRKGKVVFTVSARGKQPLTRIIPFLKQQFPTTPLTQIDSVFGFVERCTLYGGRQFVERQLSDDDVRELNSRGIGLRIPLTNHYVDEAEYSLYLWLLDKYHRKGNSVIVTNDKLARWVRRDFPKYQIEASVIRAIDTHAEISSALELYDTVVLPMALNQDFEFLEKVESKDRITLFANAGCALTCPSKICYPSISRFNKFTGAEFMCSQPLKKRELLGMIDFDLDPLIDLGYRRFKLLRARPGGKTGY